MDAGQQSQHTGHIAEDGVRGIRCGYDTWAAAAAVVCPITFLLSFFPGKRDQPESWNSCSQIE